MVKFAVGAILAGLAVYAISTDKLDSNGKFLGFIDEDAGLGIDDFAKGAVILAAAALGGMMVQKIGGPAPAVKLA